MVKIEEWEFYIRNGRTPVIDNITYYNSPNSVKFNVPGIVNAHSGVASSYDFASEPNKIYTLSGRIKAEGILGTGAPVIRMAESDVNGNWLRASEIAFDKGTYDWTLKSLNITTGPNTAFIYITSYLENSYGTYWLDDVNIISSTDSSCPQLQSMLSIYPTSIKNGESFTFISMALGGEPSDDGFGHEIFIDGVSMYNTGLRKDTTMTGTITPTKLSTGQHNVVSKITDGCMPTHQIAYSTPVALNIASTCPALSASLSITPTTVAAGGSINFTSTALGGEPSDDGFGHEILIDDIVVYNTGLGKGITESGTIQITGILSGTHVVKSRIIDGCLPTHQIAHSTPITITITPSTTGILSSISARPSENPNVPASEGYIEVISVGYGTGTLTYYKNGKYLGSKPMTISGAWTDLDDFLVGFGTWTISVTDGINTLYTSVTLSPSTCPALSASLSITQPQWQPEEQ